MYSFSHIVIYIKNKRDNQYRWKSEGRNDAKKAIKC